MTQRGFDESRQFSAYLNTLRWNCVTATDAELFQAPYRAGIDVKAYQLEPLSKALLMPRVGLFIADDVGLGKTIEAGLILREMLLRQRIRRVLISCPPSVLRQWQEELAQRFGLAFTVMDRTYVAKVRQERGYGTNPWSTGSRFLISHALLRNPDYATPLISWLDQGRGDEEQAPLQSLLILDEAHNAAPATNSLHYAIDSGLTRSLRDLAPRFEHRLFLSATPHNGHSNSFTALLELLDPARFTRGVPFDPADLEAVLVRRLKDDLRIALNEAFPERIVEPLLIPKGTLPPDTPELELSRLLQRYRKQREARLLAEGEGKRAINSDRLVITNLQKRLLSSVEAFARTLAVHQSSLAAKQQSERQSRLEMLEGGIDLDRLDVVQRQLEGMDSAGSERGDLLQRSREELEATRHRQLEDQQDTLGRLLAKSEQWLAFEHVPFRQALNVSLELLGVSGLEPHTDERGQPCWRLADPESLVSQTRDSSWNTTLDSLRALEAAKALLQERGRLEAEALKTVLRNQRQRINATLRQRSREIAKLDRKAALAESTPLITGLADVVNIRKLDPASMSERERRQLASDQKHWQRRLETIETELSSEPKRIEASYKVVTHRLEPAGLVYLWPISG